MNQSGLCSLRGLHTFGRFLAILYKAENFCDFFIALQHARFPLKRGSTLKGKNLLPLGANSFLRVSKLFLSIVDSFSERRQNSFEKFVFPERVSILLKYRCRIKLCIGYHCVDMK